MSQAQLYLANPFLRCEIRFPGADSGRSKGALLNAVVTHRSITECWSGPGPRSRLHESRPWAAPTWPAKRVATSPVWSSSPPIGC